MTTDSADALAAASVSVRHHWEELFCSNLLLGEPLYHNYDQRSTVTSSTESSGVERNGGASSSSNLKMEITPGTPNLENIAQDGKSITKFPTTPCKALQFQHGVVVGVSWGTMSVDKQK